MNNNIPLPLPTGALHELYAGRNDDGAALCGLGLASAATTGAPLLWVRQEMVDCETGSPCSVGLEAHGLAPSRLILLRVRDTLAAIQAGLEGARTAGLAMVVIELWGEGKIYDLTASRRLALAARASGTTVLVLRTAATPVPSAADTRWQARAVPTRALAANAPGLPAFEITLLRARNGLEGLRYCLEWDRDAREFIPRSLPAAGTVPRPAPLSGAPISFPSDRQGAPAAPAWRRTG